MVKLIARREYQSNCNMLKYQWICLNKLYKVMESFFQILNYWPKTKQYSIEQWGVYIDQKPTIFSNIR